MSIMATAKRTGKAFAVLTGDIIGSSELSAGQLGESRRLVAKTINRFDDVHKGVVRGKPDFFRGDAWQLCLADPRWALRVALLVRASLRGGCGADSRIAIGIGSIGNLSPVRMSLSSGEAFTLSGHALDQMTGYFDMTAALPERTAVLAQWLPVVLHLCSGLVRPWTERQAEIVACGLVLGNPTHERIAASLNPPVTKQTVTDSLRGAGWRTLLEPIRAFESTDWDQMIQMPGVSEAENG